MESLCSGRRPCHKSPASKPSHGFTVCELLVSMACIGVLLALLLPAVIVARESARRATCTSQLRELGLAVHEYHDRERRFPTAWQNVESQPEFVRGWATELLPELGEGALDRTIGRSTAAVDQLAEVSLPMLLCPSDISEATFELWPDVDEETIPVVQTGSAGAPPSGHALRRLPTAN